MCSKFVEENYDVVVVGAGHAGCEAAPSGLSRGSKDTRHLLTICTQKAARFNKGSRRSRCCGQAGYSLRASTKVRAAAGVAVKLATANGQGRPFVKLAITC